MAAATVLASAGFAVTAVAAGPSIAAVGKFTSSRGTALTSLAVSPQGLGDVIVVFAHVGVAADRVASVTGGGVASWTRAVQFSASVGADIETWYGTVTTTGPATVTFAWSGSISGHTTEYGAQEFTAGLGASTVWASATSGGINGASSKTVSFPTLTPSAAGALYFGYSSVANAASAGSTPGFSYAVTADNNIVTYDTNVSASVSPTATQSPAGTSSAVGVLMTASSAALAPPAVTGVQPSSGSTSGGTPVVITGTNLAGATSVHFGTASAAALTVNNSDQVTAISPAGAGTVDVTVTTPGGTSAITIADQFSYVLVAPTVTALSPSSGPVGGSTSVVITGTNLTGATAVHFGTTAAAGFMVNSITQVTATTPAGVGSVDVTVTTPGGTSAITSPDQFTFSAAPTGITPVGTLATADSSALSTLSVAPRAVGDVVVVSAMIGVSTVHVSSLTGGGVGTWARGEQYADSGGDEEIWYGTVTATGTATITFSWSGSISGHVAEYSAQEFTTGRGPSTSWSLDKNGSVTGASSKTVPMPALTPSGTGELYFGYAGVDNTAAAGTTPGFTYPLTAEGNVDAYDASVSAPVSPSATQSPAGTSGAVAVLLRAAVITSQPVPTVTSISPPSGSTAGGTMVTVTGTNFTGASSVSFGSVASTSLTVDSPTQLTVTAPQASAGAVDMTVTTPGGTSAVNAPADQFTSVTPVPLASALPLGVYPPQGGSDPAGIASYAQTTGTDPTLALDFLDRADGWAGMDSAQGMGAWTGSRYRLVVAVPIIPTGTGATLATGATGAYNTYFTTLAQNLVKLGLSNAILRLGWEFNGNWYAWSVANATDAANFAAYWRQIVTTMRAVPGQQFQFFFNPNGPSPTSWTADQAYPGDAYVDYVGTDDYDNSWVTPFTPAVGWQNQLNQQWGLNWLNAFSAAHHKAKAIAEWSDEFRTDGHGFGDDPSFIDNMASWFVTNNVAFTDNFCYDSSSTYRNDLLDGTFPNALTEFEKDFAVSSP